MLLGGGNCAAAAAADINGDGRLDLLSAPTSSSIATPVQLYLGNGNGTFAPPISYPVGIIPLNLAVGDFDGSGKPDIAVANYFNDFISVLLGTCLADPNAPALTAVRDAPNDQGGKVFVTWTRSALDVTGGSIQSYRVWRRIPAVAATALMRQGGSAAASIRAIPNTESGASSTSVTYWEAAATLPAQRLPGYGYTSSTSQDSLPGGNPYTAFFVTAATNNIDLFYDSAVDSGYSVDNLPPSPPLYLAAALVSNGASLHWRPNVEPDLAGYALYRGNSGDFVPSIGNQIALLSDSLYHDPNGGPGSYYKLAALDAHGNASSYTAASLDFPTALLATALAPHVSGEQVDLTWSLLGSLDRPMSVQRSSGGDVWQQLGSVVPDGEGFVRFSDRDIRPAAVYHYRLAVAAAGGDIFAGNVEVRIPAFELALAGVRPNPLVSGAFAVRFTLGNETHAVLNVVDISGRRIASVEVGSLGPGPHTVDIDRVQRVPAGLYVIRLTNGNRTLSSKAAVMR